jgi:hypothetical protein
MLIEQVQRSRRKSGLKVGRQDLFPGGRTSRQ